MSGGARIAITIVNWNGRDDLEECLRAADSVRRQLAVEVVVVDNDSSDDSVELVRTRFPWVQLLVMDENLGFAGGNNAAFEATRTPYVLVLNPDVRLTSSAVAGMLEHLEQNPEIAAVGPGLAGLDGRLQEGYYRRFPSRAQVLLFYTMLARASQRIPSLRHRYFEYDLAGGGPVDVDQVPGACMLVRRAVIDDVGPMDPGFFLWFEDVDWCYRIRAAGFRLVALPAIRVPHVGGSAFASWALDRWLWQFFRSYFRFLSKHGLDSLLRWSHGVVATDLWIKELIVRTWWALRLPRPARFYRPDTFRAVRAELRQIVEMRRRGEVPEFTAADARPPVYGAAGARGWKAGGTDAPG